MCSLAALVPRGALRGAILVVLSANFGGSQLGRIIRPLDHWTIGPLRHNQLADAGESLVQLDLL
ncbi:MAG: hypothetical protein IT307_05215 [Chloroflexi bacterium]|nr:hypothetical protein [Chloroflexota bacterium]